MASSTSTTTQTMSRRTRTVWAALVGSMTAGGALLFALAGPGPAGSGAGVSLTPLASTTAPSTVESVFTTRSPVDEARWDSIVIHHSGSAAGSPADLEAQHRAMGLVGLGYHFVVGNGTGMGAGEVHVGYRWLEQLPGAHVAGSAGAALNQTSIGICLVGDGDRRTFSDEQLRRAAQLVAALCDRFGLEPDDVLMHADVAPTTSPGRLFPQAAFRDLVRQYRR
ncbi:MAG: peptidoglycan recognition family protein [Phycisphaerales bacterium]